MNNFALESQNKCSLLKWIWLLWTQMVEYICIFSTSVIEVVRVYLNLLCVLPHQIKSRVNRAETKLTENEWSLYKILWKIALEISYS